VSEEIKKIVRDIKMNTQKKILCIQHRENDIKRKLKKSTDKKVWGVNGKMRVKKEEKKV